MQLPTYPPEQIDSDQFLELMVDKRMWMVKQADSVKKLA
jgi:hypothetical protein